jgi:hypothetical protein
MEYEQFGAIYMFTLKGQVYEELEYQGINR